jgi:hypothetical protein
MVVMAFGWWGLWNVGSDSLASQSESLTALGDPIYVAGCPVPDPLLEKDSAPGVVGEDRSCTEEGFSHPITSRRSRGGLGEPLHAAERQREDKRLPRTSFETLPSAHSHEK